MLLLAAVALDHLLHVLVLKQDSPMSQGTQNRRTQHSNTHWRHQGGPELGTSDIRDLSERLTAPRGCVHSLGPPVTSSRPNAGHELSWCRVLSRSALQAQEASGGKGWPEGTGSSNVAPHICCRGTFLVFGLNCVNNLLKLSYLKQYLVDKMSSKTLTSFWDDK